jgi:3',5'-cyclic AMP phosphodiesterase CpdA
MSGDAPTRVVVHLSDLHFGREDTAVVTALQREMQTLAPDLVIVSGDLTQRARRHQFQRARAFLDQLRLPYLVVPGNHDVPLYNLVARLLNPLGGYRRFITENLEPTFADPVLLVIGLDTTQPTTLKNGRVPDAALAAAVNRLRAAPDDRIKIVVGHHPFDAPEERRRDAVDSEVLSTLTAAGADVFLTGHLHVSYTGHTAHRYNIGGRSAIVVEAGTATSTRLREHSNAFNVLTIDRSCITVACYEWQPPGFVISDSQQFRRGDTGWVL